MVLEKKKGNQLNRKNNKCGGIKTSAEEKKRVENNWEPQGKLFRYLLRYDSFIKTL